MDDSKLFIVGANGQLGMALRRQYPRAQFADISEMDMSLDDFKKYLREISEIKELRIISYE